MGYFPSVDCIARSAGTKNDHISRHLNFATSVNPLSGEGRGQKIINASSALLTGKIGKNMGRDSTAHFFYSPHYSAVGTCVFKC